MSHQGRNTRTRWYGKPIIIVFTRQQRAAIKNCLFIQARLFSIRPHTNAGFPCCVRATVRECMCVRARARACTPVPPGAIFRLTKPLFPIFPRCVVFQLAWGRAGRKKKLPVTSAIAEEGLKSSVIRSTSARSIAPIRRQERVAIFLDR